MTILLGTPEADSLTGDMVNDSITGDAGNDTLNGRGGYDVIWAGEGDDIVSGFQQGTYYGQAGNDSLSGSFFSNTLLDGGMGNDTLESWYLGSGCLAYGGDGDDVLRGTLYGGAVRGGEGADFIQFDGNGLVDAGAGDDTLVTGPETTLAGGTGRDVFVVETWKFGMFGHNGPAVISDFDSSTQGDQLDLTDLLDELPREARDSNPFTSGNMRLVAIQDGTLLQLNSFLGGWMDALIVEHVAPDQWTNDAIVAPWHLHADYSPLVLDGGAVADSLAGGEGADSLRGFDGNDWLNGGFDGDDTLFGGGGDDVINGMNADDLLRGGAGDDSLFGGSGNDSMLGDAGNDYLDARLGNELTDSVGSADVLFGGSGRDSLIGGKGADTYHFGRGSYLDIIYEGTADAGDTVQMRPNVDYDELWLTRVENDLVIRILDTRDSLHVANWFSSSQPLIENFRLDNGLSLTGEQINALVDAMASMEPPAAGTTHLSGSMLRELEAVLLAQGS